MDGLTQSRVRARDAAMRLLNRLTTAIALAAVAAVGVLGAVSAYTIPGTTSTSTATAGTGSSASAFAPSGLQPSTTPITPTSNTPVAVSGGSR
jgi:hypothetical protein